MASAYLTEGHGAAQSMTLLLQRDKLIYNSKLTRNVSQYGPPVMTCLTGETHQQV